MTSPQQITQAYQPGRTVVSFLWDMSVLKIWNTATLAFESYNPSNVANYQTSLTDPNNVGWYTGVLPTKLIGTTIHAVNYDTASLTAPIGATELMPPDTGTLTATPQAQQPITMAYQPGESVVTLIWDMTMDNVWNTSSNGWEVYNPANIAHYRIALTDPNNIGWYSGAFPSALIGTTFQTVIYDLANSTLPIGAGEMFPPDTITAPFNPTSSDILGVVNKALMFLGMSDIVSLADDSESAHQANKIYNNTLTSLLRSHHWKFATFIQIPALLSYPAFDPTNDSTGNPLPGWEYLYAYPSNCLKIRRLFDPSACGSLGGVGFVSYTYFPDFTEYYDQFKDTLFRWEIVQTPSAPYVKAIAAHVSPAYLEYTILVADPTQWDQYFYDAMVCSLAAQLAHPLTGNTELATQAQQQLTVIISEAKRIDSEESKNQRKRMSSYQRARM